jgi:hypothetical protein
VADLNPFLIYSPTIEAGVDFNVDHFDPLYVYCCLWSTTQLGLTQMTQRPNRAMLRN